MPRDVVRSGGRSVERVSVPSVALLRLERDDVDEEDEEHGDCDVGEQRGYSVERCVAKLVLGCGRVIAGVVVVVVSVPEGPPLVRRRVP